VLLYTVGTVGNTVNMNSTAKVVSAIVVIGVVLTIMIASFYPQPLSIAGLLAVSTIKIDPQRPGQTLSDGSYTGGHWVVLADTATAYGTHCFYEFNDSQAEQYSNGNTTNRDPTTGNILIPTASIQLSITIGQPYLKSDLYEYDNQIVLPATYGVHVPSNPFVDNDYYWKEYKTYMNGAFSKHGDGPIPAQTATYWRTQNNWQVVIPLDIECVKVKADGTLIPLTGPSGTSTYHVEPSGSGSINLQPFSFHNSADSSETITFTKVGLVSAGAWPSGQPMFILRDDLIWRDDGNVEPYVKFSSSTTDRRAFVDNWFGTGWGVNTGGSIYTRYNMYADQWDQSNGYPGIATGESYFPGDVYNYPIRVTPDELLYSGAPYTVTSGRPSSLAAWLDQQKGPHLNNMGVNPYTGNYVVDTTNKVIKLLLDQNSFLWLYTLDISTDIVDTYVWRPSFQTGIITDAHWESGEAQPHIPVAGSGTLFVTVSNTGNAPGGFILKFTTTSGSPTNLPDTPTGAISPGQPKRVDISVTNLGGLQQDMGSSITISLWNDEPADQHSSKTVQVIFSASGGQDTVLTVTTKCGDLKVSGIQVTVRYGEESQSETTTRGEKTFNLGTYTGPITISTPEDDTYFSTAGTTTVHSGSNSYPVGLTSKNAIQTPWTWIIVGVVIVVGVVIAVVVIMAVALMRRRHVGSSSTIFFLVPHFFLS